MKDPCLYLNNDKNLFKNFIKIYKGLHLSKFHLQNFHKHPILLQLKFQINHMHLIALINQNNQYKFNCDIKHYLNVPNNNNFN